MTFSYHLHRKKKVKLNITFYFKWYLHHNCSINLNSYNTQLYSSAKSLHNVPSSVFGFVNFCFIPFLHRTSIQKWKKKWSCHVHKWIAKKEMLAKISKCLCQNLFIGATAQIRAVYKDHKILITWKRCITLSLNFYTLVYLTTVQIRPRPLIWKWTVSN